MINSPLVLKKHVLDTNECLIKERKGIEFAQSRKILEIVLANKIEARYLGINKGHSLLCITSVVEDVTGTYRHLSRQLCIADRFRYIV